VYRPAVRPGSGFVRGERHDPDQREGDRALSRNPAAAGEGDVAGERRALEAQSGLARDGDAPAQLRLVAQ
jgi:hypothetical protein